MLKTENSDLKEKQAGNSERSTKIKLQNDQLKWKNRELKVAF